MRSSELPVASCQLPVRPAGLAGNWQRATHNSPAFTLVELLVALMVTILLVGSAAAVLRAVTGARQVTENRLQGEQAATVALRTITSALRNAYRPVSDNDVLFEGTLERSEPFPLARVRFRAIDRRVIRAGQPESDVHEIEFFLRDDGSRPAPMLMRRTDPTRNIDPDGGGVVEPLAMDILGLDLQYFDGQQWLDRWAETEKRWPTAVNVRLIYLADAATGRQGAVSRLVNFPDWAQREQGPSASGAPGASGETPQPGSP